MNVYIRLPDNVASDSIVNSIGNIIIVNEKY